MAATVTASVRPWQPMLENVIDLVYRSYGDEKVFVVRIIITLSQAMRQAVSAIFCWQNH